MYKSTLFRVSLRGEGLARWEARWRGFAERAQASFFQDWTWVGCLAQERYRDPVILETVRDGELAALALFDRRTGRLHGETLVLHESTDPGHASPFIEHNGPLLLTRDPVLRQAILAQVLTVASYGPIGEEAPRHRRVKLSGVDPDCAAAARMTGGVVADGAVRLAPFLDLTPLGPEQSLLERLSRNTRHQIRRSNRLYEADGPFGLRRADTVETGLEFLAALIRYHDATWRARGKPGAFASPAATDFYRALVRTGVPRGEVDLLEVKAGPTLVGYLMNFRHRGRVSAYQSGFNYAEAGPHRKPGMTCHYLAIEHYRGTGATVYDFLAGADRYKLSLANAQSWLHWLSVAPAWHPQGVGQRMRQALNL